MSSIRDINEEGSSATTKLINETGCIEDLNNAKTNNGENGGESIIASTVERGCSQTRRNDNRRRHIESKGPEIAKEIPAEYIPENATDITHNQCKKLWKLVIEEGAETAEGDGSLKPEEGMVVQIHYDSWFLMDETKTIFDSAKVFDGDDVIFEFVVGRGQVIRAMDEAVRTMKIGEKSLFIAHFDYAYGRKSSNRFQYANIPNESFISTEITLINVNDNNKCEEEDGGEVQKEVITPGGQALLLENSIAYVNLEGFYEDAVFLPLTTLPFQPSASGSYWGFSQESKITNLMPPGLSRAVLSMTEGEESWITLSGSLAFEADFKDRSHEVVIRAGEPVKYFVNIEEVEELFDPFMMSLVEKLQVCDQLRIDGFDYLNRNCYDAAALKFFRIKEYLHEAKDYLKEVSADQKYRIDNHLYTAYVNLGKLHGKVDTLGMKAAMVDLTSAINLASIDDVEDAHFNRGLLLMKQKEFNLAKQDFQKVVELTVKPAQDGEDKQSTSSKTLNKLAIEKLKEAEEKEIHQKKFEELRYIPPK